MSDLEAVRAQERRGFARMILEEYESPPEGGTRVPRLWVEEHMAELRAAAGPCGKPIRFVTPGGTRGSEPCELAPLHAGDCDSSQLLLRPADALNISFLDVI